MSVRIARAVCLVALATAIQSGSVCVQARAAETGVPSGRGPVPNDAMVAGRSLLGMSEAEARAAVAASVTVPPLAPLRVVAAGRRFTLYPRGLVRVDVERMLAAAYMSRTTTAAFEIAPRFAVDSRRVIVWVANVARRADRAPRNAAHVLKGRRLLVRRSLPGVRLNRRGAAKAVYRALARGASMGGRSQSALGLPYSRIAPKVTERKLGRAVLVVLSQRRVRLYEAAVVEKVYRCAVGQRSYPTPTGTFKVIAKRSMPTWGNPGSGWARDMPDFIPAGPRNPLGTRALYLSAHGIRIHGTSKVSSIGTAASHGCVRMLRRDIEELYPLVPVGTRVFIVP